MYSTSCLGCVWLEHMELVHGQTQLAEVDVEVHHDVPWHRRREHFLVGQRRERHSNKARFIYLATEKMMMRCDVR